MCGISGILYYQDRPVGESLLTTMAEVLKHRGPDDAGYFLNSTQADPPTPRWKITPGKGNVGFVHTRLSIIDLSSGHQPMTNEDETVWITFNGEIYNFPDLKTELRNKGHRFKTNCDTEVIIHAYEEWKEECVKRLRGMFAFAIWDEKAQTLFLARDRLGIKPLYFYADQTKFLFGSEIKAILQHPEISRDLNLEALNDYFSLLYVPAPKTIFQGIAKLLPGCTLTVRSREITLNRYWDLNFGETTHQTESEWCEAILAKLKEAVSIRLISEVPLGAFLSGGVDSSAVVALMSLLVPKPVQTTSIGFHEEKFNELPYARLMVNRYKTDHYEMQISPNAVEALEKLTWFFDEPFADSSAIPTYYVSWAARQKVTVALSGDGGDENFAGYRRYYFDRLENTARSLFPASVRENIIGTLARLYPKADWLPQMFRAKTLLTNLSLDPVEGFYNSMSCFGQFRESILNPDLKKELHGYHPSRLFHEYYERANTDDPLSRVQYVDFKTYLVDDILTKVDRASMAHALEVRVPLLDHEFVELVATIPSSLKLKGKKPKYIFKKAIEPLVPEEILYRRKMGFSMPISGWLKNDLKTMFESSVFEKGSICERYLNTKTVATLWKEHQAGSGEYSAELWSILFFEFWGRNWLQDIQEK
ncbi:MAG: asparagine synthase (glutamine-hydrolyzing) [bacterium]